MKKLNKKIWIYLWSGEDGWSQTNEVMVLSYPAYCRYRAALKRLENCDEQYTRHAVMMAIGGASPPGPNTRVVFCKDTFEYPELEDHELLCNHLGTYNLCTIHFLINSIPINFDVLESIWWF